MMKSKVLQMKYNMKQSARLLKQLIHNANEKDKAEQAMLILKNTQDNNQQKVFIFQLILEKNDVLNIKESILYNKAVELTIQNHSIIPFISLINVFNEGKLKSLNKEDIISLFYMFGETYPVQYNALNHCSYFQNQIKTLLLNSKVLRDFEFNNNNIIELLNILEDRQDTFHSLYNNSNDDDILDNFSKQLIHRNTFQSIMNFSQITIQFSQNQIINLLEKTEREIYKNNHACFYILKNNASSNIHLDKEHIMKVISLCPYLNDIFDLAIKYNESQKLNLDNEDFKLIIKSISKENTEKFNYINQVNSQGNTPLMQAIYQNNEDLALYILKYQPDLTIKNNQQYDAIDLAFMKNNFNIVEKIKEKLSNNNELKEKIMEKETLKYNKIIKFNLKI